jgi:hypothetical protein
VTQIRLTVGDVEILAEFNDSETAQALIEALPFESRGSYWGGELYFDTPVSCDEAPDANEVVDPGTVAFWPPGACLCLFWGPTPASHGSECRAASKVNVVGRVMNPELLPTLKSRKVRVSMTSQAQATA